MNPAFILPQLTSPQHVITILRGSVHLRIAEIVRLEAERNYTRFFMSDGSQIITAKNLGLYEALLPATFVRVHKSHLINCCYINKHCKTYIRMNDGGKVEVSRRKWRVVKRCLNPTSHSH